MALKKAVLEVIEPKGEAPIQVLFNPTEYSLDRSTGYDESSGVISKTLQYGGHQTGTLSMELFFDTYEQQSDVRQHTDKIYGLLNARGTSHLPPICEFRWGKFHFRCVVQSVNGRFSLFLSDGTPVRATLSVTLKEFLDPESSAKKTPFESSDHVKIHIVKHGDTLSSIAAAEYEDPGQWRPIAEANRIDNPRELHPGQPLAIPHLT